MGMLDNVTVFIVVSVSISLFLFVAIMYLSEDPEVMTVNPTVLEDLRNILQRRRKCVAIQRKASVIVRD